MIFEIYIWLTGGVYYSSKLTPFKDVDNAFSTKHIQIDHSFNYLFLRGRYFQYVSIKKLHFPVSLVLHLLRWSLPIQFGIDSLWLVNNLMHDKPFKRLLKQGVCRSELGTRGTNQRGTTFWARNLELMLLGHRVKRGTG